VAEPDADVPPAPVQVIVYVVVVVGLTLCDPLVVVAPVQEDGELAAQLVAFVELQVRVELAPDVIELGLAVSETVGGLPVVYVA
jgi:hypothetical protein